MKKTPTEILKSKKDVYVSDIPEHFMSSFNQFMWGQTMYIDYSSGKEEHVAYKSDFAIWYHQNKEEIARWELEQERNSKIDGIIGDDI